MQLCRETVSDGSEILGVWSHQHQCRLWLVWLWHTPGARGHCAAWEKDASSLWGKMLRDSFAFVCTFTCMNKYLCLYMHYMVDWHAHDTHACVCEFKLHAPHCKMFVVTLTMFRSPQLQCVWHVKFKECLEFKQSIVVKLPSFVKLVSPFRKAINQHFWWGLLFLGSYSSAPEEFLGHMAVVRNTRTVAK